MRPTPSFTVGIEEEYLLVDRQSRDVASDPPRRIFEQAKMLAGNDGVVDAELLRSQIEADTRVCKNVPEAREELARLRRAVAEVAAEYGLAPLAASTHPFGRWQQQHHTEKDRYIGLSRDMQSLARRMLICGMHVHVGIDDNELRVELLNGFRHFLPLLLALSTSSPFWEGQNTGLMSYRLPVFDGFPRTGLPERFRDFSEYEQLVGVMRRAGIIDDPTKIWWDLRISARYPTLEMRITDMCTRLDDAASLAALTVSTLRMLWRTGQAGKSKPIYPRLLVDQNRWRAMRYGLDEGLVDLDAERLRPIPELLAELVGMVRQDAEALGCSAELERTLDITRRGTSAHRQIDTYDAARVGGASEHEALRSVVDMLVEETVAGL